ncbi:MAG: RpiB/LacA/LacB family sugar-phosphate isomerase [Candidatus Poribacteria bacterium]|nr:RpiB/LacA/LacB family sugar-phosphate isomerase [Candidatus Poribacteria bacterium]
MSDEKLIQRIVAEVVRRLKALEGGAVSAPVDPPVSLVTEDLVKSAISRGGDAVYVTPNAIVTPLARDLIRQQKVRLLVVADDEAVIQDSQKSSVLAIGADHKGFELKKQIVLMLQDAGREVMDCGVHSPQETSYVGVAKTVADVVLEKNLMTGIVVDGGGTGAALVANKVKGIRAVSCHDVTSAKFARAHVDANILCLGVGVVGDTVAQEIVATWLSTPFEGDQYAARVREIDAVEDQNRD